MTTPSPEAFGWVIDPNVIAQGPPAGTHYRKQLGALNLSLELVDDRYIITCADPSERTAQLMLADQADSATDWYSVQQRILRAWRAVIAESRTP